MPDAVSMLLTERDMLALKLMILSIREKEADLIDERSEAMGGINNNNDDNVNEAYNLIGEFGTSEVSSPLDQGRREVLFLALAVTRFVRQGCKV